MTLKKTILFLITIMMAACSAGPYSVRQQYDSDGIRRHMLYVVDHGWHTGLIIPAVFINAMIPGLQSGIEDTLSYEIGWGDRDFYRAPKVTIVLILQALFRSKGTVVHVAAIPASAVDYFAGKELVGICLTEREMLSLATFVGESFAHDGNGQTVVIGQGIYGDSRFFAGRGKYSFVNTCNQWTAKGLVAAGMDISPALKITSASIMHYLRQHRLNRISHKHCVDIRAGEN